jgi:hypothetical protein
MLNPDREAVIKDKLMRAALAWKRRRNRERIVRAMQLLAAVCFGVGIGTRI